MILYMIRHGQSEANRDNYFGSWLSVPLTENGKEDARAAGEKLKGKRIDKIYSSDLLRARQTCEIALPGRDYEQTPLLREINVGTLNGKNITWCKEEYNDVFGNVQKNYDFDVFGGESRNDHRNRVIKFLDMLTKRPEENVAAFSHAGTIKRMYEVICRTEDIDSLTCANGSVWVFEYKKGNWRLKK